MSPFQLFCTMSLNILCIVITIVAASLTIVELTHFRTVSYRNYGQAVSNWFYRNIFLFTFVILYSLKVFVQYSLILFTTHLPPTPFRSTSISLFQFYCLCSVYFTNLWRLFCAAHVLTGVRPSPGVWLISLGLYTLKENWLSLPWSCELSVDPQLGKETLELPLPNLFHTGILICLIMCASCSGKHRCCEFVSPATPACPEDPKMLVLCDLCLLMSCLSPLPR